MRMHVRWQVYVSGDCVITRGGGGVLGRCPMVCTDIFCADVISVDGSGLWIPLRGRLEIDLFFTVLHNSGCKCVNVFIPQSISI